MVFSATSSLPFNSKVDNPISLGKNKQMVRHDDIDVEAQGERETEGLKNLKQKGYRVMTGMRLFVSTAYFKPSTSTSKKQKLIISHTGKPLTVKAKIFFTSYCLIIH